MKTTIIFIALLFLTVLGFAQEEKEIRVDSMLVKIDKSLLPLEFYTNRL